MNNLKVILAVASGVAVGALMGILFAPGKGSATRRKISNKGKGYLHNLESNFDNILVDMRHKIEEVKAEVNGLPKLEKNKR